MNSNLNSPSPAAEPSRFFTVRLARFLGRRIRSVGRFVFSRRMVWTLAIFASLLVLLYQYENWNGARELAATRQRMIARAGTENYMDLLPPDVPDEENFYSIPEIVSWRVPDANAAGGFKYQFPGDRLLPEHFANPPAILEEPGCHRLDLEGWAKDQATAGYALPPDKSPAEALYSMLGDGAGIIPRLIAGLDRPQSLLIPSRRSIIAAAGGELAKTKIPAASSCFPTQRNLALHLRVAGLAGDAGRTRDLAGVMLRLADGMGHDITFVGGLVCMALNGVTLTALNEALACRTLTDADFRSLSDWLAAFDDVRSTERMFLGGLLATDAAFGSLVQALRENDQGYLETFGALKQRGWLRALLWGPSGWLDTNRAFLLEQSLAHAGTGEGEIWPSGAQGAIDVAGSVAPCSSGSLIYSFIRSRPVIASSNCPSHSKNDCKTFEESPK